MVRDVRQWCVPADTDVVRTDEGSGRSGYGSDQPSQTRSPAPDRTAAVRATVLGKPAEAFFATALSGLGIAADHTVMVGDDVESDVGGALRAGLAGILVRTGKYREDLVRASGIQPTATVDTIADVPALVGA